MNIYLVSQRVKRGYNTFSSMIVYADSPERAKRIHPEYNHNYQDTMRQPEIMWNENIQAWSYVDDPNTSIGCDLFSWATHPDQVSVSYLGSNDELKGELILCASYHAG